VQIHLIAIGHKMPAWVDEACDDFIRRMPPEIKLKPKLLPLIKRGKNPDIERIKRDESNKLKQAIPDGCISVLLDVGGKRMSTEKLADVLKIWLQSGQDIAIVIGGPDGVSDDFRQSAALKLSLSDLTFPHTLVRVMLCEQLYRAWSILAGHPYHRA
jgi:23S rRNA (pseudouridine1915-N3)-methyltransferase